MSVISVIMGVYNCSDKEMLNTAVNSILNQTYTDFEFIICDDGSTNDTPLWIDEIAQKDSRIIVIKCEHNKGLANALNLCIEKATGKYIARQDVDDISMEKRFELQVDYLDKHKNISFVGTDCFLYDNNGLFGERTMPQCPSRNDFLFNSPFIHGSIMFRREVFEKCGGYKLIGMCNKYEDYEFFMRAYAHDFLGANMNQLLYTFFSEERKNKVPLKMRIDEFIVRREGFKLLGFQVKDRLLYSYKPLFLVLVPNKVLNILKERKKNSLMHKTSFSLKIYKLVVNRNNYIKFNYERYINTRRSQHERFPFISWLYLLKLNLNSIFLYKESKKEKNIDQKIFDKNMNTLEISEKLCKAEVISFDIFDTLLFSPFAVPSDLFWLVGEKLNYPDFRTIRIEAEKMVKKNKNGKKVSLEEIYDFISERTGIDSKLGQQTEIEIEYDLCSANPTMKEVWEFVKKTGKKMILTSDMYLPTKAIQKMIEKNGFDGYSDIFISNEYGSGKHDGELYEVIKKKMNTSDISHIGDNYGSDVKNAKKHGIQAYEYKNINAHGNVYRPKDMLSIIGSAYSGIINRKLYSGYIDFSPAYEYGYKYGGILILGFCEYIHNINKDRKADKILFFSRDGYIVKQVYEKLYPSEKTEYVYWAKDIALKLGAELHKEDFINHFVTNKINQNYTLYDIMSAIGISEWDFPFTLQETLDLKTAPLVEKYLNNNWKKMIESYNEMNTATKIYFEKVLKECTRVLSVDCEWNCNKNEIFNSIINEKWNLNCEMIPVHIRNNNNSQKTKVHCYASEMQNHNNHSIEPKKYFDLLFGTIEPKFQGFALENNTYSLVFDDKIENEVYIKEIQKGEIDFIEEYVNTFRKYPWMRNIFDSDAYSPFRYAMKHNLNYISKVFSECVFRDEE